jgi:hypothetical protein
MLRHFLYNFDGTALLHDFGIYGMATTGAAPILRPRKDENEYSHETQASGHLK